MNETAYRNHEAALFRADLHRVEAAPLADRRAARLEFSSALRDCPSLIAERVKA